MSVHYIELVENYFCPLPSGNILNTTTYKMIIKDKDFTFFKNCFNKILKMLEVVNTSALKYYSYFFNEVAEFEYSFEYDYTRYNDTLFYAYFYTSCFDDELYKVTESQSEIFYTLFNFFHVDEEFDGRLYCFSPEEIQNIS